MNKLKVFLEMIKFEHTIFALPFAYVGAFLAQGGLPSGHDFLWITLAMVGARTAAMSLNRVIDRHIDAKNPRTASRALPAGLLSVGQVWLYTAISFIVLFISAVQLNALAVKLLPLAVFLLVLYSYTKRFTWLCHVVLGLSIGFAPFGAWIGVTGTLDLPAILLGLAVALWVAGFDIPYATQDRDYDATVGLHSIPVRFGIAKALTISRAFHAVSILIFLVTGFMLEMGAIYYLGVVIAAGILVYEHSLMSPKDMSKLDMAFFNMNGILSMVMFVTTLGDIFGRGLFS